MAQLRLRRHGQRRRPRPRYRALGPRRRNPSLTRIAALGGKYFFDDDQQFPDTQTVAFEYAGASKSGRPKQLIFEQRIWSPYNQEDFDNGNAWYGTEGMILFSKRGRGRVYGPKNKLIEEFTGKIDLRAHHRNFFDCIRDGGRPAADIEIGHLSSSLCHLGNIATRVGRTLNFDPKTETITPATRKPAGS